MNRSVVFSLKKTEVIASPQSPWSKHLVGFFFFLSVKGEKIPIDRKTIRARLHRKVKQVAHDFLGRKTIRSRVTTTLDCGDTKESPNELRTSRRSKGCPGARGPRARRRPPPPSDVIGGGTRLNQLHTPWHVCPVVHGTRPCNIHVVVFLLADGTEGRWSIMFPRREYLEQVSTWTWPNQFVPAHGPCKRRLEETYKCGGILGVLQEV